MLQLLFFHTLSQTLCGKPITILNDLIARRIHVNHSRFISEYDIR